MSKIAISTSHAATNNESYREGAPSMLGTNQAASETAATTIRSTTRAKVVRFWKGVTGDAPFHVHAAGSQATRERFPPAQQPRLPPRRPPPHRQGRARPPHEEPSRRHRICLWAWALHRARTARRRAGFRPELWNLKHLQMPLAPRHQRRALQNPPRQVEMRPRADRLQQRSHLRQVIRQRNQRRYSGRQAANRAWETGSGQGVFRIRPHPRYREPAT